MQIQLTLSSENASDLAMIIQLSERLGILLEAQNADFELTELSPPVRELLGCLPAPDDFDYEEARQRAFTEKYGQ